MHTFQRCNFPFKGLLIDYGCRYLVIYLFAVVLRNKVNFQVADLADAHLVTTAKQFQIDDVFKDMTNVLSAVAKRLSRLDNSKYSENDNGNIGISIYLPESSVASSPDSIYALEQVI